MIYMKGIDISIHDGNIDLKPYKDQFVIIRGGYWTKKDGNFERNVKLCEKLKIPYGVYWYSYALNVEEAKQEAKKCLEVLKKAKNIQVGVWFDMEDADGYKKRHDMPTNNTITKMCNTFCNMIKAKGYYTGVYASQSWFGTKIKSDMKYPKWIANWGKDNGKLNNDLSGKCVLHQYTSKPLDKNVMYNKLSTFTLKEKEEIKKESSTTNKIKTKTLDQIAKEVINGKWGNGEQRKKRLEKAGYNYSKVQKKVNELVGHKSEYTIALEVINGEWGNNPLRKRRLKKAGYDYKSIQSIVNKLEKSRKKK